MALLVAFAAASCGGDDGGTPPGNEDPVAAFTAPECTVGVACAFTDASTDPDGNDDITAWEWDFGDGAVSHNQNPARTYTSAGDKTVELTVTDASGASSAVSHTVTVSGSGSNQPPTADFTFVCNAQECTFTDASDDPDGTIEGHSWDFDDGSDASTEASPVHTYDVTELTTFSVTLTVTDNEGATDAITKDVAVAPAAGTTCEDPANPGEFVACTLDIPDGASVTLAVTIDPASDCTADGNTLKVVAPFTEDVFTDGCHETKGTPIPLNGGAAVTGPVSLELQMISGSDDPDRVAPRIQVTGGYPEWTLNFDDGEDPTNPSEPDFDDLILKVTATP